MLGEFAMSHLSFVLPNFAGGGAERVALSLILEFLKRGHSIDLVLLRREGDLLSLIPPAVRIVDLKATRLRNAVLPLARYLREARPDGVQVSMWPLTVFSVLAHKLARSRARLVLSDHGTLSKQYGESPLTRTVLRYSLRSLYPSASAAVSVSEGMAQDMSKLSG